MAFVPRLTEPSRSDPHWIQTGSGGKNPCIYGSGNSGNSVLPNCVGWSFGRFMEILGSTPKLSRGDAGQWYGNTADGYKRGSKPQLGAVACWAKPGSWGHVAIVEQINSDGSIITSNSGWNSSRRFWTETGSAPKWINWSGYVFQGFIYNPAVEGMRDKLADFLDIAERHVGENGDWTWKTSGLSRGQPWCAAFVMAVAKTVGGLIGQVMPMTYGAGDVPRVGVPNKMGTWFPGPAQGRNAVPQPGDMILFRWSQYSGVDTYYSDHIGIVRSVDSTSVHTIEGNSGGSNYTSSVKKKSYPLTSGCINGYYRPDWSKVGASSGNLIDFTLGPLYDMTNTRADATLLEIGYMNSALEPSIYSSNIKLSLINYTTWIGSMFAFGTRNLRQSAILDGLQDTTDLGSMDGTPRVIVEYFQSKGLNAAAGIGIIANIKHESGFRTDVIEYGYTLANGGVGLCQWTNYPRSSSTGRRTNMINMVGSNWRNNLTGQLDYLWYELTTSYTGVLSHLKSVPNSRQGAMSAADYFVRKFEVPANVDAQSKIRQQSASEFWDKIVPVLHTV